MQATLSTERKATPSQPLGKVLFTSGGSVTINAPASAVFDVIAGFSKYGDWNTWTPALTFKEPDADVGPGCKGVLKTVMKDQAKDYEVPVEILELKRSPEEYRLSWQSQLLPWWAFGAERVQVVTPVSDTTCEVCQWESMSGAAAYAMMYLMGVPAQLNECNVRYLDELKAYAEASSH